MIEDKGKKISESLTVKNIDDVIDEGGSEDKETPLEIRLTTVGTDYRRRRRSSSRVHYRRNVRRIISDCRRAKRSVILETLIRLQSPMTFFFLLFFYLNE